MIKNIKLTNFKCFEEQEFNFNKLTIFTGFENSGKHSVLESLFLFKNSNNASFLNLSPLFKNSEVAHVSKADVFLYGKLGSKNLIEGLSDKYVFLNKHSNEDNFSISINNKTIDYNYNYDSIKYKFIFNLDNVRNMDLFKQSFAYVPNNRNELISEGFLYLDNMKFNSNYVEFLNSNVFFFHEYLNLKDGDKYEKMLLDIYKSNEIGLGLKSFYSILCLGRFISQNGLLIIEHPENNLHPSSQSDLAYLLCKLVETGVQVVLTTHSDHIINGIRLFIAKHNNEFANDVIINNLDNEHQNTEIHIDKNGYFDKTPEFFFDQVEKDLRQLI